MMIDLEPILARLPNNLVRTQVADALAFVARTVVAAELKHSRGYNSPHEGWAVLLEEVEELWDEVKADNGRSPAAAKEAAQVAAVAVRYIAALCPDHP